MGGPLWSCNRISQRGLHKYVAQRHARINLREDQYLFCNILRYIACHTSPSPFQTIGSILIFLTIDRIDACIFYAVQAAREGYFVNNSTWEIKRFFGWT